MFLAETGIGVGDIIQWVRDGGIIALLIVIIYGGIKQWWVYGWMYRSQQAELEEWKRLALSGTLLAEKAVELQAKLPARRGREA